MNLQYTIKNNNCLDLQFLKYLPQVWLLDLSNNKIECVDNVSILQMEDINLKNLDIGNNNLVSFDFGDLIGSSIIEISLKNNNLSIESVKNFDNNTLSKINPTTEVRIYIKDGNDEKFSQMNKYDKILVW